MKWAVVALCLLPMPAMAIECQPQAGNGSWGWRMIDERKCWYEGRRVIAKEQLRWPKLTPPSPGSAAVAGAQGDRLAGHSDSPTMRAAAPMPQKTADAAPEQPSRLERPAASALPAQILFPVIVAGNILETYPIIWPQPWLASESIMQWPRLLDIDRVPFAAWDKRIGQ